MTLCRAGSTDDICDPAEYCDGTHPRCPANVVRPNTFECRPAAPAPTCDIAEHCPGTARANCPADQFAPMGTVCRAGSGDACNPDEACAGGTPNCPVDQVLPNGVSCDGE